MVVFHPAERPQVLSDWDREAERDVWAALETLKHHWHVFYSVTEEDEAGYDREVDYILLWRNRIIYIEVKGGLVFVDRPARGNTRWRHTKRNGEPLDEVRPAQLWNAKKAIGRMIGKKLKRHLRRLGFIEYEFHVFPHTPASLNGGKRFDRGAVHYIFQEDMGHWAAQLETLVRLRTSRFAEPADITMVAAALHDLAYPADAEVRSYAMPISSQPYASTRSFVSPQTAARDRSGASSPIIQPPRKFDLTWRRVFLPWLCGGAGFLLILLIWPQFESVKPTPPTNIVSATKSSPVGAAQSKPTPSAKPAAVSAPVPVQKVAPVRIEEDLPSFIPAGAVAEIERIFETARIPDMSLRWSAGNQYGYVTLQADEGNGCRRWRISRNDTTPTFDFVRRCS